MRRATDERGRPPGGRQQGLRHARACSTTCRCAPVPARSSPSSAPAAAASRRCSSSPAGCRRPRPAPCRPRPPSSCPSATASCPGPGALDNAALPLRLKGAGPRDGARGRARDVRHLRPRRLRGRPARTSCPAACASASPSCARCSRASRSCASTSRSPRSTRSRARRCRPGSPTRCATEPRTVAARDARRRGGARARRPRRRPLAAARRRVRATLDVDLPRPRSRTDPALVAAARARARGAGRVTAALLVLVLLGAWEVYARSGAVDDLILPAPTQIADAIGRDHRAAVGQLPRDRQRGRGRPARARSSSGSGSPSTLHFSRTARRAVYPLLVGVPGAADRRHRAAAASCGSASASGRRS